MIRSSSILLLALPLLLLGCGRKAKDADLPPEEAQASEAEAVDANKAEAPAENACLPTPFWAEDRGESVFIELLHIPAKRGNRNGAGYRLHEDGRIETYTDVELFVNDEGKLDTRPGDAIWKTVGSLDGAKLEEARELAKESSREELEKWAPKRIREGLDIESTLLTIIKGDETIRTCYFGDRPPAPIGKVEKAVHDYRMGLRKAAKEAEKAEKVDKVDKAGAGDAEKR